MANEKFIHTHESYAEGDLHDHPSMASHRKRLEEAISKLTSWRKNPEPIQLPQEIEEGGLVEAWYPEAVDQEITLWQAKDFK